ncbi:hypothetical protein [Streptomyces sp. NPDC050287]|uniref:hypothetical protein n=1 Tax=Streptomyces sp. NPDC050287 TaxID=3365608 RepID=UPI00379FF361
MLVLMTFTMLIIALSIVVVCVSSALSISTEPPFWVVLIACSVTCPLSTALLGLRGLADAGQGFLGEWSVRLAVVSAVTALLSLVIDGGGRGPRTHATD